VAASPALAAPPTTPSLTGEHLVGPTVQRTVHCNADGTGYVPFSTSGAATGPYSGTFTEQGVLAFTKANGLLYENFYAKFQIQSSTPAATINGVKAEIPPETIGAPPGATCQSYALVNYGYTTIGNAQPNQYGATISRDGQTYSDKGSTDVKRGRRQLAVPGQREVGRRPAPGRVGLRVSPCYGVASWVRFHSSSARFLW
jgi:hypothetical protein